MVRTRNRTWEEKPMQFEETADVYSKYCSDYPQALIDTLIAQTGVKPGDQILEVGAGSGKATGMFADRGFSLTCVEPGQQLVTIARETLQDKTGIEFIVSSFEDWPLQEACFDLAFSAQAFHWVKKTVKYEKCARALKKNRYLALFWNIYVNDETAPISELSAVCKAYGVLNFLTAPEMEQEIQYNVSEMEDSKLFHSPVVYTFSRVVRSTAADLINFLSTGAGYQDLTQDSRKELDRKITAIFDNHSGVIDRPIVSALYLSEKITRDH